MGDGYDEAPHPADDPAEVARHEQPTAPTGNPFRAEGFYYPDRSIERDFWKAREDLATIYQWAQACRVPPWSLLLEVMARMYTVIPPEVRLPPLVGKSGASLNVLIGHAGRTGRGKDATEDTASSVIELGADVPEGVEIGTGEGISRLFVEYDKKADEQVTIAKSALLSISEIDYLAALVARGGGGATIGPVLRKVFTGARLGAQNAGKEFRIHVPKHSYRLCISAGIQPERSALLLDDADGGTPQRWFFSPTVDPYAPDIRPDEPRRIVWHPPDGMPCLGRGDNRRWPDGDPFFLEVCSTVRNLVDDERVIVLRGGGNKNESHSTLNREKAAAFLGLLDGYPGIRDEDWELSGIIAAVSAGQREFMAEMLRTETRLRNEAAGYAAAAQAGIIEEVSETRQVQKTCKRIMDKLTERPEWWSHSDLRRAIGPGRNNAYRDSFEDSLESLISKGSIQRSATQYHGASGFRYRLAGLNEG